MFEEDRPVQSASLGRGVEMAGYGSTRALWVMALLVFLLMAGGFVWMWNGTQQAEPLAVERTEQSYPLAP